MLKATIGRTIKTYSESNVKWKARQPDHCLYQSNEEKPITTKEGKREDGKGVGVGPVDGV